MSVATSPASTHTPAYGHPGGGGSVWTRPGWWRALLWTILAAALAIAVPALVRVIVGWPWWQYEVMSTCLMIATPLGFLSGIGCFDYWGKYIVGSPPPSRSRSPLSSAQSSAGRGGSTRSCPPAS